MKETSLSYDFIIDYFKKETIEDRYKYLYDKMQEYITVRKKQNELFVSEEILQQVVMDYFTDVYRLKEFHKIKNINMTKIVAYEIYWILRRKPIQIIYQSKGKKIFANEGFATTFVAHECMVPQETEPLEKNSEIAFLEYLQHLNYYFKYRNVDKQSLERKRQSLIWLVQKMIAALLQSFFAIRTLDSSVSMFLSREKLKGSIGIIQRWRYFWWCPDMD